MLAQDIAEGLAGMEQQSKFYLLWAVAILMTPLFVMVQTLLLLCLGLAIGGVAVVVLARRFPGLYATDEQAWHPTDETQAINPAATTPPPAAHRQRRRGGCRRAAASNRDDGRERRAHAGAGAAWETTGSHEPRLAHDATSTPAAAARGLRRIPFHVRSPCRIGSTAGSRRAWIRPTWG